MTPIRYSISPHVGRQFSHGNPTQPLRFISRHLHSPSVSQNRPRSSKVIAYTGSAIAVGVVCLSTYWAFSPSKPPALSVLDERRFQPYAIISKEAVSSNSSIYTLRPGSRHVSDPYTHLWAQGIWSVEFKQPQLQIARSYTPLPPTGPPVVPGDLRFLIRKEQYGEVSNYLDRLRFGAIVDIRGPRMEYEVPDDVSEVLFLAGGTGIAPALQVAYMLLSKSTGNGEEVKVPRVHIFWANRRREDCAGGRRSAEKTSWWSWGRPATDGTPSRTPNPIVQELQDLEKKFEGRVKIHYMIDEEDSFIGKPDVQKITARSGEKSIEGAKSTTHRKKLLLISGPDGFVDFYAGPREWGNGRLGQGRLGGLLGSMVLADWTIIKL